MNISIDYPTLYATVARSLSIIGKRSTDDNGNLLFKDITLGSLEKPIVYDFFATAFIDLSTELSQFVTAEVHTDLGGADTITLTVTVPDNWNTALTTALTQALKAYCVSYALYSWFIITAPRISAKYSEDCTRLLAAVIRLIHEKKTPATPLDGSSHEISPLSISTTVTDYN